MPKANQEVENKAEDTANQEASPEKKTEQEVENKGADDTANADASQSETNNQIDYKAELEKVTKERDNYKTGLLNEKAKHKTEDPKSEEDEEDPGYVTAEQLTRQIESSLTTKFQADLDATRKEMVADTVADVLESLSDNPDKQKLILWHYENSIKQSGVSRQAIRTDLNRAVLLADESRLARENSEMKEALKAKKSLQKPVTGSNQAPLEGEELDIKLTPAERSLLERHAKRAGISLKEYIKRRKSSLTSD